MKTLEEIHDQIQLFSLKDPKQVTADDLIQVVNLLGNVVEHLQFHETAVKQNTSSIYRISNDLWGTLEQLNEI